MQAALFSASGAERGYAFVFALLLTVAAVSDVRTRRIPNVLVAFVAASGLLFSVTAFGLVGGLKHSLGGLLLGLAIWLPFYMVRWLGAGDVKLFAAAGAWLGIERTLVGALLAALLGGVLAVAWMLRAYGVAGTSARVTLGMASPRQVVNRPVDSKSRDAIPYGVALALGALAAAWLPQITQGAIHGVP